MIPHLHSSLLFDSLKSRSSGSQLLDQTYEKWGTIRSFNRPYGQTHSQVIWWDGLRGGHNDIGWAEGSIDLVRRIAGL